MLRLFFERLPTLPGILSICGVMIYLGGFALSFVADNALPKILGLVGFAMVLVDAFVFWSKFNDR
jgi:hypothetical protein